MRPNLLAAVLLPLLLLAGCAGLVTTDAATPPAASSAADDPSDEAGTDPVVAEDDADATSEPTATPEPAAPTTEAPVATREATWNGNRLALDVYPLHRDGRTTVMTARLRVITYHGTALEGMILGSRWRTDDPDRNVADGFQLIDQPTGTAYLPALHSREGRRSPTCTELDMALEDGAVIWVTCAFGAPEREVDHLTVQAQTFGAFTHVPVR